MLRCSEGDFLINVESRLIQREGHPVVETPRDVNDAAALKPVNVGDPFAAGKPADIPVRSTYETATRV